MIGSEFTIEESRFVLDVTVPAATKAVITLPGNYTDIMLDGKTPSASRLRIEDKYRKGRCSHLSLVPGNYRIEAGLTSSD